MSPEIIQEKPLPLAFLKERLKAIKKRDEELTFRGNKTEEYINQFNVLKKKDAEELYDKIAKLKIPRMKDEYVYKIIDLLPKDLNELKNIFSGYSLNVTNDNLGKIQKAVAGFLPKKK